MFSLFLCQFLSFSFGKGRKRNGERCTMAGPQRWRLTHRGVIAQPRPGSNSANSARQLAPGPARLPGSRRKSDSAKATTILLLHLDLDSRACGVARDEAASLNGKGS